VHRQYNSAVNRACQPLPLPKLPQGPPQSLQSQALLIRPERLYAGYIFDLDGTLYLGEELLSGAQRLIQALRAAGRRLLFLSNNPTKDPDAYAAKLSHLGIPATPGEVLNTVVTTTRWLQQHHPDATVFAIAEEPLRRALRDAGFRLSEDPAEIDVVVASYDRTFEYRKLQIAFDALWYFKRARFIATNPDRYCPFPGGRGEPDAAAIVAAIEACTGVRCERHLGKPDPYMLATALDLLGLPAHECIMTGDRLYTDVRMARDAGMPSALVLTGETTPETLHAAADAERPQYVLDRVDALLPATMWRDLGWPQISDA
jgi:HAD superfamily hydrolase (TIGR01450 family)